MQITFFRLAFIGQINGEKRLFIPHPFYILSVAVQANSNRTAT